MATGQQPFHAMGDLHVHGPSFPSAGTVTRGTCIVWHNDGPRDLVITFKSGSPDGVQSFPLGRERGQYRQEARYVGRFWFEVAPAPSGPAGAVAGSTSGPVEAQIAVINVM